MTNQPQTIANIADYKPKLFELYTRFRYNELICDDLMGSAVTLEKMVRVSVVGLVGISLLTGTVSFFNVPQLAPLWAIFTAFATLLSIYSLIVGSGAKQFSWFGLARRFHAVAEEVEFFSEYVRLGKITDDELLEKWQSFSQKLGALVAEGGIELQDYAAKNGDSLRDRLATILKRENKSA